ncbi:MAG: 2-oxoacid:acceptor oxidoreductase family protein [Candidatus Omnitrophica bacterium]|nr:2-oxoacid:acceptor oxidoreductase family protein [Candidatus Omnitrophota bacterium]MBU4473000.1 2-oxoacid:acceptor oxidoreductase family protein [Candidatus Omnitrophota bacterium]MCG2706816.1 2-oxoacid:acceptor oxidoreductase family protein [Candidatus Omnitrophota bacterium]
MVEKIIIAGAGGQGIMLVGRVLAEAALKENKHITWLPCYGAEVRGGTAYCMVIISEAEIGSPYIDEADTLIIMNHPSLEKFKGRLKNNGLLIVNSSLAKIDAPESSHLLRRPFTETAIKLGNIKTANIVALGCYITKSKVVAIKTVLGAIEDLAGEDKKGLVQINHEALKEGIKLVQ